MTTTEKGADPAPEQPQESRMRKTKQTTKAKSRTAVKAKTTSAAVSEGPKPGSKLDIIHKLLSRKNGCTAKDVMEACKWPSVSMPQQAKALDIKLSTEKIDGVTHYKIAS